MNFATLPIKRITTEKPSTESYYIKNKQHTCSTIAIITVLFYKQQNNTWTQKYDNYKFYKKLSFSSIHLAKIKIFVIFFQCITFVLRRT